MSEEAFANQLIEMMKDFQARLAAQSDIAIECFRLQLDEAVKKQSEAQTKVTESMNGGTAMSGKPASPE